MSWSFPCCLHCFCCTGLYDWCCTPSSFLLYYHPLWGFLLHDDVDCNPVAIYIAGWWGVSLHQQSALTFGVHGSHSDYPVHQEAWGVLPPARHANLQACGFLWGWRLLLRWGHVTDSTRPWNLWICAIWSCRHIRWVYGTWFLIPLS